MQDEVTKRVLEIKRMYKLSQAEFADLIKVQRSSVSHMVNGRNRASVDVVLRLLQAYDELSADWLMRGVGPMFNPDADENLFEPSSKDKVQSNSHKKNNEHEISQIKSDTNLESKSKDKEQKTKVSDSSTKIPQGQATNPIQNTGSFIVNPHKQIVRIIIFYADKTFTDFRPE